MVFASHLHMSQAAQTDVPLAVGIGLAASFVQSLGLTLQRRSHVDNASLTPAHQRDELQRPQWVTGFAIFLVANVAGTLFQIGTLPVVILAPLGAVSLLYNALLARVLLNDFLSRHMAMGTYAILMQARRSLPSARCSLPTLARYQRSHGRSRSFLICTSGRRLSHSRCSTFSSLSRC